MWLGLKAKSGGTVCDSPSTCGGRLQHHLQGQTSNFVGNTWINADMDIDTDGSNKMCIVMDRGTDGDTGHSYEMHSQSCTNSAAFYCKIPCPVTES